MLLAPHINKEIPHGNHFEEDRCCEDPAVKPAAIKAYAKASATPKKAVASKPVKVAAPTKKASATPKKIASKVSKKA